VITNVQIATMFLASVAAIVVVVRALALSRADLADDILVNAAVAVSIIAMFVADILATASMTNRTNRTIRSIVAMVAADILVNAAMRYRMNRTIVAMLAADILVNAAMTYRIIVATIAADLLVNATMTNRTNCKACRSYPCECYGGDSDACRW